MKLLFDHNLPPRLAATLQLDFPGSIHVRDVGLQTSTDVEIWDYAAEHDFTIVSKDSDFHHLSFVQGAPPKTIWIRLGNCTTLDIEQLLHGSHAEVFEFGEDSDLSFLILA